MSTIRVYNLRRKVVISGTTEKTIYRALAAASTPDAVSSVFSRTGAVTAASGDYDLSKVDETADYKRLTTAERAAIATNTAKVTNATHTGDVTGSGALTIAAGAVTNAKLANVATLTLKGRSTAGAGSPEDLTATQARALLNVADGATADQTDAEIETAYNSRVAVVPQAEAEAGTATTARRWTAQRVGQAVAALAEAAGALAGHLLAYTHSDITANTNARHAQGTDSGLDTGGANAVTAAQAQAAWNHSQVTSGYPHWASVADIGAIALNATGALGNLGATPSFTGVDGTTYSAAYSADLTTWAGVTLASGAGIEIGPIPNSNPWAVADTGLTPIFDGALDDIASPGVVLTIANLGGTLYARASLPA